MVLTVGLFAKVVLAFGSRSLTDTDHMPANPRSRLGIASATYFAAFRLSIEISTAHYS